MKLFKAKKIGDTYYGTIDSPFDIAKGVLFLAAVLALLLAVAWLSELAVHNFKVTVLIGAVLVFLWVTYITRKKAKRLEALNSMQIMKIADQLQEIFEIIKTESPLATRLNNIDKAILLCEEAERYDKDISAKILNQAELKHNLHIMKKALPAMEALGKTPKLRFAGNDKAELEHLVESLYLIKKNNITDQDFLALDFKDEETGNHWKIADIIQRARDLGWQR